MPIDASIALGVRPPQFVCPVNAMAKIMQLKGLQQDQEMNTMRADEYRRGVDRQNRLMGLMQGGSDPETLRRGGFLKEAAEWEKNSADTGKTKAETDKTAFSMNKERFGVVRKTAASFANDPQITKDRVVSALQLYAVGGVIPETLATQFSQGLPDDPAQLRAALQNFAKQDLTSEQLFTLFAAKPEKVDNGQQIGFRDTNPNSPTYGQNTAGAPVQKMQSPDSVASGQVQMRGQNMSDSRARERLAFDQAQPKGVLDPERGLLVDPRTGEARPVTMGGKPVGMKEKPLTEGQAKAALFGSRMEASDKIIGQLAEKGATTSIPGSRAGYGVGATLNLVAPAAQQQLDQAKRDFINATLRRESGAVISEPEVANAEQQYFPQIGDKPEVIKQKAQKRAIAIRGVQAEVPKSSDAVRRITGDGASQPNSTQGGDSDPLGIR